MHAHAVLATILFISTETKLENHPYSFKYSQRLKQCFEYYSYITFYVPYNVIIGITIMHSGYRVALSLW